MTKRTIALMIAGLVAVPLSGAVGQTVNLASIPDTRGEYVVFFDNGTNQLSSIASDTVQKAADASRSARSIQIEGRADYANAVKAELVRRGTPAETIRIRPAIEQGLERVGRSDPVDRRVEISF